MGSGWEVKGGRPFRPDHLIAAFSLVFQCESLAYPDRLLRCLCVLVASSCAILLLLYRHSYLGDLDDDFGQSGVDRYRAAS